VQGATAAEREPHNNDGGENEENGNDNVEEVHGETRYRRRRQVAGCGNSFGRMVAKRQVSKSMKTWPAVPVKRDFYEKVTLVKG
jgi:hypothetical protein